MATKKCPYCAEEIQVEAVKCKHCSEMLNKSNNNSETKKERPKTSKKLLWWMFIIGFLFFCWLYSEANKDYSGMSVNEYNKNLKIQKAERDKKALEEEKRYLSEKDAIINEMNDKYDLGVPTIKEQLETDKAYEEYAEKNK